MFGNPRIDRLEARVRRLEKLVNSLMQSLGHELEAHPAEGEIDLLIQQGRKIEAIRRVRELSGTGLREAKLAVDAGTWRDLLHA